MTQTRPRESTSILVGLASIGSDAQSVASSPGAGLSRRADSSALTWPKQRRRLHSGQPGQPERDQAGDHSRRCELWRVIGKNSGDDCTGSQPAGFRSRTSGKMTRVIFIRGPDKSAPLSRSPARASSVEDGPRDLNRLESIPVNRPAPSRTSQRS